MTHTIRLRSAWRSAGATHTRRFHKPTGLEGGDRVYLAASETDRLTAVRLNASAVDLSDEGRADVTDSLVATNELVVEADDPAVLATVRLEIEPASA